MASRSEKLSLVAYGGHKFIRYDSRLNGLAATVTSAFDRPLTEQHDEVRDSEKQFQHKSKHFGDCHNINRNYFS